MISPDELSHFENIWESKSGNLGHDDWAQRRHQFGAMPLLQARQRKERSHHEFAGGRDTIHLVAQMVRRVGVFSVFWHGGCPCGTHFCRSACALLLYQVTPLTPVHPPPSPSLPCLCAECADPQNCPAFVLQTPWLHPQDSNVSHPQLPKVPGTTFFTVLTLPPTLLPSVPSLPLH